MCASSFIMDHYNNKWNYTVPVMPNPFPTGLGQPLPTVTPGVQLTPVVTREEFDALRKDVLEMKELVKKAMEYDRRTGQPDCESDDKVALIRKVAEMVGVNVDDVFGSKDAN